MPLIEYSCLPRNVRIQKRMFAPKRFIADPMRWYRDAAKLIPQLPKLCENFVPFNQLACEQVHPDESEHWHLECQPDISIRWIKFTMVNKGGIRAHLVIDRQAPSLGP